MREADAVFVTTSVLLPAADLQVLRLAAVARASATGQRPSVSAVLRSLIEQHRAALTKDTAR